MIRGYRLQQQIGRGNFGVVYKAQHIETGRKVVIKKQLIKSGTSRGKLLYEVTVQQKCKCDNVVEIIDYFFNKNQLFIVMEKMSCTLGEYMKKYKPDIKTISLISRELLKGINVIAEKGFVHKDIKPENILINLHPFAVKISDFGSSRKSGTEDKGGSLLFQAPECIRGESQSYKSDLWALGITMCEMINGNILPFDTSKTEDYKNNVCRIMVKYDRIPAIISDLCKKIFVPIRERITIQEMFNDPFLKLSNN